MGAALPDETPPPSFEPVITPPAQIAQPWEQPKPDEPPITTAFQPQPETSSLPPLTAPLTSQPTGSLLTEPVPPPDFLTGLVSSPTATPPPSERPDVSPESASPLVSFSTLPTATPPPAPVFEVVMEEEPPVRGTDLLPDELVAMRQPSPAVNETAPAAAVSETPSPTATEAAEVSPFTLEVTDRADDIPSAPTEADMPAAVVTTEAVATSLTEVPALEEALEETAPPATDEAAPGASALPAFVPTPLEAAPWRTSASLPRQRPKPRPSNPALQRQRRNRPWPKRQLPLKRLKRRRPKFTPAKCSLNLRLRPHPPWRPWQPRLRKQRLP